MNHERIESSLDDFLKAEGAFEEVQTKAIKEVVVSQLRKAMTARQITKTRLAALLNTSRSQDDRLLAPTRDVTFSTLQRAAALVGRTVQIELVLGVVDGTRSWPDYWSDANTNAPGARSSSRFECLIAAPNLPDQRLSGMTKA